MIIVKFVSRIKIDIFLLLILILGYFILRLPNLTLQPIFADEAIYIRWAQVMRSEPTLRFLPQASEGKQPLFMWIMISLFKFISDPLLAGRFLSTLTGFGTLIGIVFLTFYLFKSKKIAFLSGLIYVISPMAIFFDRMALVDSMLSMLGLWTLILSILFGKKLRIDLAMITGFSLGGALLTKSPAIFFEIMMPLVVLISSHWPKKGRLIHFAKIALLLIISLIIANAMYNILRLGPSFSEIAIQNKKYVFEISHLWTNPKDPFIYHLRDMFDWFWLLGPNLLIPFTLLGVIIGLKNNPKNVLPLLVWALIPLFAINMLAKVFTVRYILYTTPAIFILASLPFLYLKEIYKQMAFLLLIAFVIFALKIDFLLLTNPEKVALPKSERTGYFEEWTAGYGLREIAQFLEKESAREFIVVGTEGTFGTLPEGLQIYFDKNRQVAIIGGSSFISDQVRNSARLHPTYFVANKNRLAGYPASSELLKIYQKAKPVGGQPQDAILLFQIFPNNK